MATFTELLREIHTRSVWQILGGYVVAAWFVLQAAETVSSLIGLPLWFGQAVLIVLGLGLPIIAFTAIVQGRRGSVSADRGPSTAAEDSQPPEYAGAEQVSAIAHAGAASAGSPKSRGSRRLFTWRNAIVAGVGAFLILGLTAAGHMATRSLGIGPAGTLIAKGLLDERDQILLADFDNETDDPRLGAVVTEALRVDLTESEIVEMVDPAFAGAALARMGRPVDTPLERDVARQVALREGIKAVLAGEIVSVGDGFQLVANLISGEDGSVLLSRREAASDPSKILGAIDRLSKSVRERMGESLRAIRAAEPLEQVTTASLEALTLYSEAVRAIEGERDPDRGLVLLEEAIVIDTAFAAAYRKIGVVLGNRNEERARSLEMLRQAFEHRDRLTRRERFMVEGTYYSAVGDDERSLQAYERMVELWPDDSRGLNNLGLAYLARREFEASEEIYRRAIEADSSNALPYTNLLVAQAAQGDLAETRGTLDAHARRFPTSPVNLANDFRVTSFEGDYERASSLAETEVELSSGNLFALAGANMNLGTIRALRGQFGEAWRAYGEALDAQLRRGSGTGFFQIATLMATIEVTARGDSAAAIERLQTAREQFPLSNIDPLDRPYIALANSYAGVGDAATATALLEEYVAAVPDETLRDEDQMTATRAAIALAEGRFEDAIELTRRSDVGLCSNCAFFPLALSFDRAGVQDSAILNYEAYLDTPVLFRVYPDAVLRAATLERLAELYDEKGNLENAARYYAEFVELWLDADSDVQPRVQAAQQRLQEIFAARG
jgi:tetratricopeptide (TPR) repeat protein